MSAGYILSVVHKVLHDNWRVKWTTPRIDEEVTGHHFELGAMSHLVTLGAEIHAIDGFTLRTLCCDLGLDFDTVRTKIEAAGGQWHSGGPRPQ